MTPVDRDILELLRNEGNGELRLTPGLIAENLDWGDQAVREHTPLLRKHGLVEYVDESRGVYQISDRGRAWLRGDLPTEELEEREE
ncbi:winged helix-turn-helix domain-containing protein [Halarchaeum nitratireducens]|nr:winged helix-turn-helix domain-containing protein [Halarchaeum nitratireducens]